MNINEQVYRIKNIMGLLTESSSDIIFVKYALWDNSKTVRHLPLPGESAWAIKKSDLFKYEDFLDTVKEYYPEMGGGSEHIKVVEPKSEVVAVNYADANNYVMGNSNHIPEPEPFNSEIHCLNFRSWFDDYKGIDSFMPKPKYQVLI
jgi:hypothetical protein